MPSLSPQWVASQQDAEGRRHHRMLAGPLQQGLDQPKGPAGASVQPAGGCSLLRQGLSLSFRDPPPSWCRGSP